MLVLIDNGHGVGTPGKQSPDGTIREYRYTRELARRLQTSLKARGIDSELLVPEEADVSLGQRCMRANAFCDRLGRRNVLLVSLHLNAAGMGDRWMGARGWEAWTSPGATDSDRLAECLYDAAARRLPKGTPLRTDTTDGDRDKEARFQILTGTRCAAVLTENLFQDNESEVRWLRSRDGLETLALLHAEGIQAFVGGRG